MRKRIILMTLLLAVALSLTAAGCSLSGYGKIRPQPSGQSKVAVEDLIRNWRDYDVYYYGVALHKSEAVLFDPKGDNKTMTVHPWWVKLEDPAVIRQATDWMYLGAEYDPVPWRVLGPNDDFFAYIFTFRTDALIKVVDENTLWIDQMSLPSTTPSRWSVGAGPSKF